MQKRETSGNSASEMQRGLESVARGNVKPAHNVQPLKPTRPWSDSDVHNVKPTRQPSEKQTVGTDRY